MHIHPRPLLTAAGALLVTTTLAGAALATSTLVEVEAVDHYPQQPGYGNIVCIAEAENYQNGLVDAAGSTFTLGDTYTDNGVYDTDFTDPDRTGHSYDADTYNFDMTGIATAYFAGHGNCEDDTAHVSPIPLCNTTSDCSTVSPPAGSFGSGTCLSYGPPASPAQPGKGSCFFARDRHMIINNAGNNHYAGIIEYSSGSTVKWGESSVSGAWGGAAENGGVNFAVISNSCGLRPPFYYQEAGNLFAGLHLLGIVMPITPGSDDWDAPDRGTWVANAYATNPNSSVTQGFVDAINSMSQTESPACPYDVTSGAYASSYTYGGGHGIGGCGAHTVLSVDKSSTLTTWHTQSETWVDMQKDQYDATGGGWISWVFVCNYDCGKYPISL